MKDISKMKTYPVKEDRAWTVGVTRDRRIEKESLKEYVNKKREMFLVQVSALSSKSIFPRKSDFELKSLLK